MNDYVYHIFPLVRNEKEEYAAFMSGFYTPPYWQEGLAHLSTHDAVMARLIATYPASQLQSRGDIFHSVMRSIVGQQISVKAADAVWSKMEALVGKVALSECATITQEQWRSCGLSRQKISYIGGVIAFMQQHASQMTMDALQDMPDEQVLSLLTRIRGIGVWSAEMCMIFCLMRPNVLPLDDIGLQRAMNQHYGVVAKPFDKAHARKLAQTWQPYCAMATWFLWRAIDPSEVHY